MKTIQKKHQIFWGVFMAMAWAGVLLILVKVNGRLSVSELLQYQPENKVLAILTMTVLFLMKSVDFLLHSGVLFAANGVMFPLPAAITLNVLEAGMMFTLSYFVGKIMGEPILSYISEKHPRIRRFAALPKKSELTAALILRAIGTPATMASLYMGAAGFRYGSYLVGSVIGMLPLMIAYTVMGVSVGDLSSPVFWIALASSGVVSVIALFLPANIVKHEKAKRQDQCTEKGTSAP